MPPLVERLSKLERLITRFSAFLGLTQFEHSYATCAIFPPLTREAA